MRAETYVLELCYFEQIQNHISSNELVVLVLELCYFEQIQNHYCVPNKSPCVLELCYFEQIQNINDEVNERARF